MGERKKSYSSGYIINIVIIIIIIIIIIYLLYINPNISVSYTHLTLPTKLEV